MIFKEKLRNKIKELTKENEELRDELATLNLKMNTLKDEKEEEKHGYKIMIDCLREQISELKTNKDGLYNTIKRYEKDICKSLYEANTRIELTKEYRELIKLYNRIEGDERCYKRYIG